MHKPVATNCRKRRMVTVNSRVEHTDNNACAPRVPCIFSMTPDDRSVDQFRAGVRQRYLKRLALDTPDAGHCRNRLRFVRCQRHRDTVHGMLILEGHVDGMAERTFAFLDKCLLHPLQKACITGDSLLVVVKRQARSLGVGCRQAARTAGVSRHRWIIEQDDIHTRP